MPPPAPKIMITDLPAFFKSFTDIEILRCNLSIVLFSERMMDDGDVMAVFGLEI